jgi:hypothetical protein
MNVRTKDHKLPIVLLTLFVVGLIAAGIVYSLRDAEQTSPTQSMVESPTPEATAIATTLWNVLLQATPFAYHTPLPEPVKSKLDGLYAKIDSSPPQWWRCYRCADYRPAGGIWRLKFEQSVMRIYYEVTGWRTIASFTTSADHLYIFNDPYCPEEVGEYKWQVVDEQLMLEAVDDHCAFDLRAKNLSLQLWVACTASTEPKTPGCEDNIPVPESVAQSASTVNVDVYGGDSRFFAKAPELMAIANTMDREAPKGISIRYDGNTIPSGIHRVLWWNGNWIEATTDLPFNAIGVQFFGEAQIGWARVLFDGEEVWRGNTADLYVKDGRHGGYIEVTGFEPGRHTIRAESLGFDYRPVTVVSFGFSKEGGVEVTHP